MTVENIYYTLSHSHSHSKNTCINTNVLKVHTYKMHAYIHYMHTYITCIHINTYNKYTHKYIHTYTQKIHVYIRGEGNVISCYFKSLSKFIDLKCIYTCVCVCMYALDFDTTECQTSIYGWHHRSTTRLLPAGELVVVGVLVVRGW